MAKRRVKCGVKRGADPNQSCSAGVKFCPSSVTNLECCKQVHTACTAQFPASFTKKDRVCDMLQQAGGSDFTSCPKFMTYIHRHAETTKKNIEDNNYRPQTAEHRLLTPTAAKSQRPLLLRELCLVACNPTLQDATRDLIAEDVRKHCVCALYPDFDPKVLEKDMTMTSNPLAAS